MFRKRSLTLSKLPVTKQRKTLITAKPIPRDQQTTISVKKDAYFEK